MARKNAAYGPLLFINTDPSDGGTAPHRRAIYQHVQLKYANWRRVEKSRKARAPVKASGRRDGNESSNSYSQSSYSTSDDACESSPIPSSVSRKPPNIEKSCPTKTYFAEPLTILRDGNSDPFGVLAVRVGSKINALMQYSRDYYLPGIQRDVNNPGSEAVGPEWAQCISYLRDEGLAYSHFARIATVIASDPNQTDVSRDFHTQALIFKSKSMILLRKRLEESPGDSKTYNQILLLMNAELYDRNFVAASSHAAILVNLLQSGIIKGDPVFTFKVVYHDAQRAAMSLTRPLFDLDHWVPAQMIPIGDLVKPRLSAAFQPEVQALNLDSSLDYNPPLKDTLAVFRHLCLCLLSTMKSNTLANSQVVFYGRFQMTLTMGRLINHYLDAAAILMKIHSIGYAHMSASVSLATLLVLRCLTRIDSVKVNGDITLFSANKMIMQRLKKISMASSELSPTESQKELVNARLYTLFIGAWVEQAQFAARGGIDGSPPKSSANSPDSGTNLFWFSCEFAEQARAMELYKWTDVKKVLQGFIYADVLEPTVAQWFPRVTQMRRSSAS